MRPTSQLMMLAGACQVFKDKIYVYYFASVKPQQSASSGHPRMNFQEPSTTCGLLSLPLGCMTHFN